MEPTNEPSASKPAVPPIAAPTGIDLHPAPRPTVRISKRAGIAIIGVLALLMLGLAWGGYRRSLQNQATARQAGLPRTVTPAHADDQLLHGIPPADASLVHPQNGLVPKGPNLLQAPNLTGLSECWPWCRSQLCRPVRPGCDRHAHALQSADWTALRSPCGARGRAPIAAQNVPRQHPASARCATGR
jgi:hypothetical protein